MPAAATTRASEDRASGYEALVDFHLLRPGSAHRHVVRNAEVAVDAGHAERGVHGGDPAVAMGAYAMALFVLGFGEALGDLVDARHDEQGLLLDEERLPQRVRVRKSPTSL